jgi:carbamoyl-phosphate synthase large subunit
MRLCDQLGFPLVIRPSFTLGGTGGSIAYNKEEFAEAISHALDMSPVHEALVEESVLGWKEYELEVMRDYRDNFVVICTIENFDPMGVHTGDSITVAPAQTLTDKEYQRMRDAAAAIIREVPRRSSRPSTTSSSRFRNGSSRNSRGPTAPSARR